jgi:septum formation protein
MSLWCANSPLVLASKSEVRRSLLEAAGLPVEVVAAAIDERAIEEQSALEDPGAVATLLAREKALRVADRLPGRLVVGADQTLSLDHRRFSKPTSRAAAREQLLALAGRTHELHAAVAVVSGDAIRFEHVAIAHLTMRRCSQKFLDSYLEAAGSTICASVGGYQLERIGVQLFERIDGDHFTVLGLPLLALLDRLRREGLLAA